MKKVPLLLLIPGLIMTGCSGASLVERENLTSIEERSVFVREHPESDFVEYIRNGEIVRGMGSEEVIASWGMPDVYLVSMEHKDEFWVYYVRENESNLVFVYTLRFNPENRLADWDIDTKRFASYSLGYTEPGIQTESTREISIRKK